MGSWTAEQAPVFLLVLARTAGLVFVAPPLGEGAPPALRGAVAFVLAAAFAPLVPGTAPASGIDLALSAAGELSIGLAIGFAASILFAAARAGGRLLEQQLGLTFGEEADPTAVSEAPLGGLKLLFAIAVYLAIDGHHALLSAVMRSFEAVPPGVAPVAAAGEFLALNLGAELFAVSLHTVAPVLVALLVVSVGAAIASRAVPELDPWTAAFGPRLLAGLFLLVAGAGTFAAAFVRAANSNVDGIGRLIDLMGGRP